MSSKAKIITRFPPSPTGYFHIGSARTALFNYLFAAHGGGVMHFRFEDTDVTRSKKEYEKDILDGLHWLGIPYEMPKAARQSERLHVYREYIKKLIESGHAYEAETGTDNPDKKVVRFKNPNTPITFTDLIRGEVTFDTTDLKDFVIAKSTDEPLYHLAVVADDHETGVTHVIRGEDHISNTPRQILILQALGFTRPIYAHIPLILAPDRSKLSKRHGAVSVNEYKAEGYLPEAFVNYLALLGWNPGGEEEVFTMKELVQLFDIARVHKSGAIFDQEKFLWLNQQHSRALSDEEYTSRLAEFSGKDIDPRSVSLLKERTRTLEEANELLDAGEFTFLAEHISYPSHLLVVGSRANEKIVVTHLKAIVPLLERIQTFSRQEIKDAIFPYAEKEGRHQVLWPLRVALSGREKSPDPFVIASLIGKEKTLKRIASAIKAL